MNPQLQNWDNFCQYHTGDWHGTWTRYSSKGEVLKSFQCVRSLRASEDGSEIYHQNHYTYADGKIETKTFGPYQKQITNSLFLDNSFSWGSTKVELGATFNCETGFRYENKRASLAVIYHNSGLQRITAISEHLASFAEEHPPHSAHALSGNWRGTLKRMTPDWIVSPPVATSWNRLENLRKNYLTLHFPDGISVSCPPQLESGKEFFTAVDWLVNPGLLYRGIRHYDTSGFTSVTLEVFSIVSSF